MRRASDAGPVLVEYEWDEATGIATMEHYWPLTASLVTSTEVQRRYWLAPEERAKLRPLR
jgi:hypothetical protein